MGLWEAGHVELGIKLALKLNIIGTFILVWVTIWYKTLYLQTVTQIPLKLFNMNTQTSC